MPRTPSDFYEYVVPVPPETDSDEITSVCSYLMEAAEYAEVDPEKRMIRIGIAVSPEDADVVALGPDRARGYALAVAEEEVQAELLSRGWPYPSRPWKPVSRTVFERRFRPAEDS